MVKKQLR